jgi:putative ABC transport system permease protein
MIFLIAARNVFRQKRRSILTVLTMFGGFTLAAFSIGWSDGSYSHVIDMFTRNRLGHIQVHHKGYLDRPSIYKTIEHYNRVGAEIGGINGVQAWTPRLFAAGLGSAGDKTSAVQVIGIDPEKENAATRFDKKITQGTPLSEVPHHQTVLGKTLAEILSVGTGDSVVIVSQAADGSIANDIYELVGIASTGDPETDRMAMYLHLADAQDLFVLPDQVHEIAVVLFDINQADHIAGEITRKLDNPNLSVATWKQFAAEFYRAMQADREGAWIMLFVVALVVAVGVLNTVLMTVLERRREYGLMRALGTRPAQLFRMVLLEVLVMAVVSIALGCGAGYLLNYALSIHGIPVPGESFTYGGVVFNRLYTEVNAQSFYIPALCVILTAIVVSVFPALRAAKAAPARTMKIH